MGEGWIFFHILLIGLVGIIEEGDGKTKKRKKLKHKRA